jgi:hypothetical protein
MRLFRGDSHRDRPESVRFYFSGRTHFKCFLGVFAGFGDSIVRGAGARKVLNIKLPSLNIEKSRLSRIRRSTLQT